MIILTVILSLMVVILGYTTFNLLRKNEKQEDILIGYMSYLNKVSDIIEMSDKKLKEIDTIILLPFLELFLIVSQFFIFIYLL